ncbi:hypothetical protein [Acidithiobacillus sp. HP-11]|uniref:hypothetical protein n=1 Tax=Acidithiobacillus sp. HP-11 TaxID=2697656 RepID=UPI001879C692|nr:hypothetical protein [Acidithiobacillus sp. HP-11]MBE7566820.1 hypothetical protein [Acidithiobacillus sp. HP-11]
MESTKLSARVASYRDAIKAARDAGVTWGQLAALFNANEKYFWTVCKAMDHGRYKPCEQLPLPEREVKKSTMSTITSNVAIEHTHGNTGTRRPLPSVTRKIGDGSKDDRLARLKALGIDVSTMEDEE